MGLEGMVKLKNPDHNSTNDVIAISNDPKSNDTEAKRYNVLYCFCETIES